MTQGTCDVYIWLGKEHATFQSQLAEGYENLLLLSCAIFFKAIFNFFQVIDETYAHWNRR